MEKLHPDLREAAQTLGWNLPVLARAASTSEQRIAIAEERLRELVPPESSSFDVLVLGSIARLEASDESDVDFLLVAHEKPSDPLLSRHLLEAVERVRRELKVSSTLPVFLVVIEWGAPRRKTKRHGNADSG